MTDATIFKAYDVRGTYPDQINKDVVYKIGRAFVRFLKARKLIVGRDARSSSEELQDVLIKGIGDEGADVLDIGLCSSPLFYFAVDKKDFDGGIYVGASHNPKGYNGLKFVRGKDAYPFGLGTGLEKIRELVLKEEFGPAEGKGEVERGEILEEYLNHVFGFVESKQISSLRIVADAGNGVAGVILPKFFSKLDCQIIPLFWEPDGSFPNHIPNPSDPANLINLKQRVKEERADLGLIFDGDCDRVIFVDEKGEKIRGDFITGLMAEELLKTNPGQKILIDITSSRAVKEMIEENNGKVIVYKRGHSFIKEKMRQEPILLAGEATGHYYLADNGNFDSPFIVILYVLKLLSRDKEQKISQLVEPYKRYFQSEQINFKVADKEKVLKTVEDYYKKQRAEAEYIDGISIKLPKFWFNLRPSNTEPVLRLNLEGRSREIVEEKIKEIRALVGE